MFERIVCLWRNFNKRIGISKDNHNSLDNGFMACTRLTKSNPLPLAVGLQVKALHCQKLAFHLKWTIESLFYYWKTLYHRGFIGHCLSHCFALNWNKDNLDQDTRRCRRSAAFAYCPARRRTRHRFRRRSCLPVPGVDRGVRPATRHRLDGGAACPAPGGVDRAV